LDKKTKDLGIAEKSLSIYESRVSDLSAKYNQAVADRKKISDDFKDLDKECEKLRKQVEELRKHLEDETLARIDLENNLQSLREELSFKEQVYNQELTETRTRRQVEISEIDGRLTEQYEAKLQQSLQELRDQYEAQMRVNREEIELLYENKVHKFLVWHVFGFVVVNMKLATVFKYKYYMFREAYARFEVFTDKNV
jgi:lamin B